MPSELVARVAALGLPGPADGGVWASWWMRGQVAAALVVTGAVMGNLSGGFLVGLLLASFQSVAAGVGSALHAAGVWMSTVMAVGTPLVRAALVLGGTIAEPWPLSLLLMNVLVASAALAALRRMLTVREV